MVPILRVRGLAVGSGGTSYRRAVCGRDWEGAGEGRGGKGRRKEEGSEEEERVGGGWKSALRFVAPRSFSSY